MSGAATAVLLGGCSAGAAKEAAEPSSKAPRSPAPSVSASGRAVGGAQPSATPFEADADLVPRTKSQGSALAEAVVFRPQDWGRGFKAQQPARSASGTVAVLDGQCRWQRRTLPKGVLASLSQYSELPGSGSRGAIRVTAAVTVHATEPGADDQLATTLEEVLRCPEQQVRTDERITDLMSVGTPFGLRGNTYADDSVYEHGFYVSAAGKASYRWMVTRLGPVTVAVSLKGTRGYTNDELEQYVTRGTTNMLDRVRFELGGKG
ncbi:hypothetical protein ABZ208_29730 [Streptomyces sp. NPDC006208]|uniref:hypothetical protein n=1 Tax=Streptomyces sp. NPDC006208 TaxID=3156734 RepID=UPI0033AD6FCC